MRTKLNRALYWVLGIITFTGIIGLQVFGNKLFDSTPIDIQLHDTYYVFPKSIFLTIIFIGLWTTTYLVRRIYFELNNKIINGILTLLLLIIFMGLIIYLGYVDGLERHMSNLYSREMDKEIQADGISGFKVIKSILWLLLIITGTILTITGYKMIKPKNTV